MSRIAVNQVFPSTVGAIEGPPLLTMQTVKLMIFLTVIESCILRIPGARKKFTVLASLTSLSKRFQITSKVSSVVGSFASTSFPVELGKTVDDNEARSSSAEGRKTLTPKRNISALRLNQIKFMLQCKNPMAQVLDASLILVYLARMEGARAYRSFYAEFTKCNEFRVAKRLFAPSE